MFAMLVTTGLGTFLARMVVVSCFLVVSGCVNLPVHAPNYLPQTICQTICRKLFAANYLPNHLPYYLPIYLLQTTCHYLPNYLPNFLPNYLPNPPCKKWCVFPWERNQLKNYVFPTIQWFFLGISFSLRAPLLTWTPTRYYFAHFQ